MSNKLTPMQQFAVDELKKYKGKMSPNYLANLWRTHKHGRGAASSRYMFGCTSAAYRTLRGLAEKGIITIYRGKTLSGYSWEEFEYKL